MGNIVSEPAMQIGYVVADLNSSIEAWVAQTGIGPWMVFRGATLNGRYAGQDTTVTMDVAMGYTGTMQIELMQITSSSPSPYQTATGDPKLGAHHIAWLTDDLEESITRAGNEGLQVLFAAEGPGTRVAYLESPAQPGVVFEYIQNEAMKQMIAYGIEQARTWDGSDPIRG